MTLVPPILDAIGDEVTVIVAGSVPDEDQRRLVELGVSAVVAPGTPARRVTEFLRETVGR